jgi:hypothetical protein
MFRNRQMDPKTIFRLGMLCLLISILAPRLLHPASGFGQDLLDGARGVLLGASLALSLWALRLGARRGGKIQCG